MGKLGSLWCVTNVEVFGSYVNVGVDVQSITVRYWIVRLTKGAAS
jgi:hypothetical protein